MTYLRLSLTFALITGPAVAQSLGLYAMLPVVQDHPFVADRVQTINWSGLPGTGGVEQIHTTVMRDSAGRLREETEGTEPDQRGSFRKAAVRILDPISMEQTDLDVSEKTYIRSPIPPRVTTNRQTNAACTGPLINRNPDGSETHHFYQRLARTTIQGVAADGCRITAEGTTPGFSYVSESWTSPGLPMVVSFVIRYDNGREDSDRITSLSQKEPDGDLFKIPAGYTDMKAPAKRTNFNPNVDLIREYGSIEWHEGTAILEAGGSDAASVVASTLRDCLGLAVSSERPIQTYAGDLLDLTNPEMAARPPDVAHHLLVGKPAKVHVEFRTHEDGSASDPDELLQAVARDLNVQQPYEMGVEAVVRPKFTMYAFVPHATHNEQGVTIHPTPYLSTPMHLAEQKATIADLARQMTAKLTRMTGHHFDCCEAFVAGRPWGEAEIDYRGASKPAREILADLLEAAAGANSYMAACAGESCVITLQMGRSRARAGVCKIPRDGPR